MPRYVALLRALNVGGAHAVKMDALRRLFEGLGYDAVSSYIASGNIIFESAVRNEAKLENQIEEALMNALGFEITPFVRRVDELAAIAAFKPFPSSPVGPRDQLGVIFLGEAATAEATRKLAAARSMHEEFRVHGREVYWLRHRDPAGDVYRTVLIEKIFDQPFTIRSITTVAKLAEKYARTPAPTGHSHPA